MSERKYNNTYPPMDAELKLADAGLVAASAVGQVDSADAVIDFGADTFRSGGSGADGQAPYVKGDILINLIAVEVASNDEVYHAILQLSDTADFSGIVRNRCSMQFGNVDIGGGSPDDVTALERYTLPFDNEFGGRTFRYARLYINIAGAIATGINLEAWMTKAIGG